MRVAVITLSLVVAVFVLAAALTAEAQQAARIVQIGYLAPNLAASRHLPEAFRQGLRDLGYVEGRDVIIEYRDAAGRFERLPALAAELVALKVDVIVAGGTPAALAAKQATGAIPIVFAGPGAPVTSGLVASLARPGGNVTGLSSFAPELVGKCLEQLKQAVPRVGRVHMSPKRKFDDEDDVLPEYGFRGAVRGKYYERYRQGTNVTGITSHRISMPSTASTRSPSVSGTGS